MNQIEFEDKCRAYLQNYVPDLRKCFVAGGFFARHYHDMPIRDIDVYVDYLDDFDGFVKEFKSISNFKVVDEKKKFCKLVNTDTNVGIDLIAFHKGSSRFTQLFDFTITQGFFQSDKFQSHSALTFPDIVLKRLRFTGRSFAVKNDNNLLTRMKKYMDLGFEISQEDVNNIYHYLMDPKSHEMTLEGYSARDKDDPVAEVVQAQKTSVTGLLKKIFG